MLEITGGEGVAALVGLGVAELRAAWLRLYQVPPPPRLGQEVLRLGVAWKLQALQQGGLRGKEARRLAELARTLAAGGEPVPERAVRLRQGARLVRAWQGQTISVLVLDDGFDWQGRRWASLSQIARAVTGTRWSGPRFFGLTGRGRRGSAREGTDAPGEA